MRNLISHLFLYFSCLRLYEALQLSVIIMVHTIPTSKHVCIVLFTRRHRSHPVSVPILFFHCFVLCFPEVFCSRVIGACPVCPVTTDWILWRWVNRDCACISLLVHHPMPACLMTKCIAYFKYNQVVNTKLPGEPVLVSSRLSLCGLLQPQSMLTLVVVVLTLLLSHGYNAVRGHRTGSDNSGAEDYLRRKTNKNRR